VKNFLNPVLRVANAVTVNIDFEIVRPFSQIVNESANSDEFDVITPRRSKWHSDIRWISARTPDSFRIFEEAFERLGLAASVAPYLDLDREPRLYFGSIIVRSRCDEPNFHTDWQNVGNRAFTALTPISDNASSFGLLYEDFKREVADYQYRTGEAIMFGDYFRHSTKPGRSEQPVAILSFEFGTDKMEYWDNIHASIRKQARLFRKPDGNFFRNPDCGHSIVERDPAPQSSR